MADVLWAVDSQWAVSHTTWLLSGRHGHRHCLVCCGGW